MGLDDDFDPYAGGADVYSDTESDGGSGFGGDSGQSSGKTVSEMMLAAEAAGTAGGTSQSGKAGKLRKLAGRLGFGDAVSESGSIDSRLTSVVSESTPGPALDLLRGNKAFAFPDLDAWMMLVLPTTGEFGGLSKRTRSEDKGQFIQMVNTETIDAVVTNELLADDALGLVPTLGSLGQMKEFGILTDARYVYGVACADVISGAVKVFAVPAVDEVDATGGRVFARVEQVATGKLPLSALVDPRVVAAMLSIYRNPALRPGEGDQALDDAVHANMELMVDAVARGGYPTPAEFVANLDERFSSAGIKQAAARVQGSADTAAVPVSQLPDPDSAPSTPADSTATTPSEQETGSMSTTEVAQAGTDEPDFDAEPDFGADTSQEQDSGRDDVDPDAPDFSAPVPVATRGAGSGGGVSEEMGLRAIFEQIQTLREDVLAHGAGQTAGGVPVSVPSPVGPVEVVPGSDFTYEQALESAGRRYINDELDLYVDPSPFLQRLTWAAPSLDVPVTGVTPWLGEQVQTWIAVLDENIKTHHEQSIRNLYRRYTELADQAAATTNAEFDPRHNPASQWGQAYAALERDRLSLSERMNDDRLEAERRAREQWDVRRKAYIDDAAARASQEFEYRNATRIEADVRDAGERIIAGGEALHEHNLAEFNDMRRRAAREFMDAQLSTILQQLDDEAASMQQMNAEMVDTAVAAVQGYLDEHRQKDVEQAEVTQRKLVADDRLDQARREAADQIAKIRSEADDRVAAMAEDMRRRAAETVEQLKINEETTALQIGREQARVASLTAKVDELKAEADERVDRIREIHLQELESAKRAAQSAHAERDLLAQQQRRKATLSFWLLVVGLIVALVIGAAAGFGYAAMN